MPPQDPHYIELLKQHYARLIRMQDLLNSQLDALEEEILEVESLLPDQEDPEDGHETLNR